jgi:hypothetical protein
MQTALLPRDIPMHAKTRCEAVRMPGKTPLHSCARLLDAYNSQVQLDPALIPDSGTVPTIQVLDPA